METDGNLFDFGDFGLGDFVWMVTRQAMTAWELADAYTRYAGRRCA